MVCRTTGEQYEYALLCPEMVSIHPFGSPSGYDTTMRFKIGMMLNSFAGKKHLSGRNKSGSDSHGTSSEAEDMPEFVYPYGCTLTLNEPAVAILSSGSVSCPPRACVAALSQDMTPAAKRARGMPLAGDKVCKGRVLVLGSAAMLSDSWLDKEGNAGLMR